MTLKTFNLERALAGDPVIAGWDDLVPQKVKEISLFKEAGVVAFTTDVHSRRVFSANLKGWNSGNEILFMAPKKETWWFVRDTQAQEVIDAKTGVVIDHKLFQSGLHKGDRGKNNLLSQYGTRVFANQKVLLSIEIEE